MNRKRQASIFSVWMFLFTVIPLGLVIWFAFTDMNGNFTLANFPQLLEYSTSFIYSIWVGLLSTLICLILAYPLAFFISRLNESSQRLLIMLVLLPMWMNSILRITALQTIINENGFLNQLLTFLGLPKQNMMGTTSAVVLGMVFDFLPFMVLPLYSVMTKIDNSVIEAARDLGANAFQVFKRVLLPLSIPGITSGITMVFVPSVSTFVVSKLLGSAKIPTMIGEVIEFLFKGSAPPYYNIGAVLSLILMVLMVICMAIMGFVDKDDDNNLEGLM